MPEQYDVPSIERVVEMVTRVENATIGRRNRMDADYKRQRGDPYDTNVDAEGGETGSQFKSFTANEAGTFVKKVVAILAGAKLLVNVPYGNAQQQQRSLYDIKERFAHGLLAQADDSLLNVIDLALLEQLCWFAPNRGWVTIRGLLVNGENGETLASAKPWDPRNVFWEVGPRGLLWACHRIATPAAELMSMYPQAMINVRDDDSPVVRYDFYTPTMNGVMTAETELKPWTPHGSPRVPVIIVPVPTQPQIWAPVGTQNQAGMPDTVDDFGESVLATNRGLYDHMNEVMSITLELLSKAREPSAIVKTDEEDTEMDDHPSAKGGVTYLAREDTYQEVAIPETTKDSMQFLAGLTGMLQRGAFPYSAYGEVNFTLSGYAITQLNQQVLTVIGPQARAISRAIKGLLDLWVDQFMTGAFHPMMVRGGGQNKDYMQVTIFPQMLQGLPPYEVKLEAQLPQDDISRLTAAQTARQPGAGGRPFLPDRWLHENYLHLPDTHLIDNMIKEQMAETMSPMALALTNAKAAMEQGRMDLMQVWVDEMQRLMVVSSMTGVPQGASGGTGRSDRPGMPPTVLPFMAGRGAPVPPNAPTGEEGRRGFERQS